MDSSVADTPGEIQRNQDVRAEVEALVRLVVPEEIDTIDAMLDQFKGREDELLATLRTIQPRNVAFRTRAALPRRSGRPPPRRTDNAGYRRDGAHSVNSHQTGESATVSTTNDHTSDFILSWLKRKDSHRMTALKVCAHHPNAQLAYHRVKFLLREFKKVAWNASCC